MTVDTMEEVWRELEAVIALIDNKEISERIEDVLDYLYMVEERL